MGRCKGQHITLRVEALPSLDHFSRVLFDHCPIAPEHFHGIIIYNVAFVLLGLLLCIYWSLAVSISAITFSGLASPGTEWDGPRT